MNFEELRAYCLSKKGATEGFPFGPDTLVFKIGEKLFLLTGLDSYPLTFNVKCNPELAIELREQYPHSVIPGFHMNKKHWNTIIINGELTVSQLKDFIDHSYNVVLDSLPKKIKEQLLLL